MLLRGKASDRKIVYQQLCDDAALQTRHQKVCMYGNDIIRNNTGIQSTGGQR